MILNKTEKIMLMSLIMSIISAIIVYIITRKIYGFIGWIYGSFITILAQLYIMKQR